MPRHRDYRVIQNPRRKEPWKGANSAKPKPGHIDPSPDDAAAKRLEDLRFVEEFEKRKRRRRRRRRR